jgi:tetratricopeptide (TPR) repeat protein
VRGSDHGQCLTEETLTEYLEGALDPAVKAVTEVHLVSCDDCREQLGCFMHLLREAVAPEEEAALETISVQWDQTRRDQKMARGTGTFPPWFLALVGVAAVVLIGFVSVYFMERRNEPKSAGELVHLLLSKERPFESQMSNEPYLHIVRTRSAETPGINYRLLAGEMTEMSAGTSEMGRFYLLQKDFGRATPYLELAARESSATAAVHNDLGVAYLEAGDPVKMEKAGSEFRQALLRDPRFSPAIFNLALFYERTNATEEAVAEWKRYLELDPDRAWASEARTRIERLSH